MAAPGDPSDPQRPAGRVMRMELRPYDDPSTPEAADGDVTNTGGYLANRVEVYDRIATRATAPSRWPDPVDSVRWYGFSIYIPEDFATGPSTRWLTLLQWKGLNTGSPPLALEIAGDQFRLGGKTMHRNFGGITRGRWSEFVVGIKFSPDPSVGWVTVRRNGAEVVPVTNVTTMNTFTKDGATQTDPNYLKQGIYRSAAWTVTHTVYFGPTRIGTTSASVS